MPSPVTTSSGQVQLRDSNTFDHLLDSLPIDDSNIIFSQLDKESTRACQSDKLSGFQIKVLANRYQKYQSNNLEEFIIFALENVKGKKLRTALENELNNLRGAHKPAQQIISSVAKILSELPIEDLDALITKSEDRPLREKFYKHIIDLAGLYKQLSNPEACRVKISIKTAVLWACLGFFDKTNETAKAILELRGSNSLKIKHLKQMSFDLEASGLVSDALHIANLIPSDATKVKEKTIDQILKPTFLDLKKVFLNK